MNDKITNILEELEKKYKLENQNMEGYLEGLVYNKYLDYWDYINLDALLNLQHPRTDVPDEMIFIMYHQITELYFKLTLWEVGQIINNQNIDTAFFTTRLRRMIAYFTNLTHSFEIMINGMEPEQFLKFRLSLLPASGFQSVQYRMIEIASTELINLVEHSHRDEVRNSDIDEQYKYIYWKKGATDLATGDKTLTLSRFEEKYYDHITNWAKKHKNNTIHSKYGSLPENERNNPDLIKAMREYDLLVNVTWPGVHLKSAGRYLAKPGQVIAATGGTNWQKYLPAKIQRRVFFPELWSEKELGDWGK